jgi:predicted nucleic acid-binding protein
VAGVIVLDAGVLIAANDPRDAHHPGASAFIDAHAERGLGAAGVTLAESLVHAVPVGLLSDLLEDYEILGIEPLDVPGTAAGTIARIRAETRLRMPDALVVYVCEREQAELATTDHALAKVATARGIPVHNLSRQE